MHVFLIFLLGASVLIGALILNGVASLLGLPTWYSFLVNPKETNALGYIWLFLVYPFSLGLIAYVAGKWVF